MKRTFIWVAILTFLCFALPCESGRADENLLTNGGFETLTDSGEPMGWYPTAYRNQPGYSRLKVSDSYAHSGLYSVMIENASANDARYTCTVRVKPSSLYRLSAYVLVESMEDTGNGANLGVEGIYSFSDGVFDTAGEWKYIEWYGETGKDQKELTFGVRVGGYSAESTGKAYFDDVRLEEVDELPTGVVASIWYKENAESVSRGEEAEKHTLLFAALGLLFIIAVWLLQQLLASEGKRKRAAQLALGVGFALACCLRVLLAINISGYTVDINCFEAWSLRMAEVGPSGFYTPDYFCDYPPGAMLLLWPVGFLLRAAGQNESLKLLIVKLPALLCDIAGAACLYAYAQKRINIVAGAVLCCLYLFNPAVLVNGAAWGQMDSVLSFLLMLTVFAAMDEDWKRALPLFTVSALIKPQALLFAPIGLAWLILALLTQKKMQRKTVLKQIAAGMGIALLAALLITLPFSIHQPWNWLVTLYADTLSSYAYATLNTANLYYLIGANWASLEQAAPAWLMAALSLLFACCGIALLFQKIRRRFLSHEKIIRAFCGLCFGMSAVQMACLLFGASYAAFGYAMMAFVYLLALLCTVGGQHRKGMLPFAMALLLSGIYTLGIKVHERYLFPALLLFLMSYCESRDGRVLGVFAGFTATTFLNTAVVLENCLLYGSSNGHLNMDTLVWNHAMCVCNLALYVYAAYVGINGLRASASEAKKTPVIPPSYRRMLLEPMDFRLHWQWRDTLTVGIVTLAYAVLAFSHLGSTVAPQTAWVSTSEEEQVVLELPSSQSFHVLYYAGVSYNDFSIEVSEDGSLWSESYPCKMREGLCYRWLYAVNATSENGTVQYSDQKPANVLTFQGKYLKIKAERAGLNLWEIAVRDVEGKNLPLKLVSHTGAQTELLEKAQPAENLIDETDTCVGEPGWYNGTYFDEIYHARTAYEHLHGQAPYETTHPPLGKLLMAACIAIFGMTPFGWRFAGALIGVLMLPALYALGLQITHKRGVATVSMLAFGLDLMHFTQTRIATIDSFPVFFILLSYLFMVRYMQMNPFCESPKGGVLNGAYLKTWIPLGLCGVCMGLSISSKWIGMYSAVGLAVLFFLTIVRQYRASTFSWEMEAGLTKRDKTLLARLKAAQVLTLPRILATCGACVVFFILVPLAIYCLCYIPYLSPTGPVTISRIFLAQKGMLDYHSTPGLGMDHPFQSPWWQWPLILKPMWFAQDAFEPAGYASTIMCMGNPWVFYIGALTMAVVLLWCIGRYVRVQNGFLRFRHGDGNLTLVVLSIGFLAQYLPWVLVPRSMYMYHYFASVPFIILASAHLLAQIPNRKIRLGANAVYVLGAAIFFVLFFPYASGYLTSTSWLDAMKWFSKLYY